MQIQAASGGSHDRAVGCPTQILWTGVGGKCIGVGVQDQSSDEKRPLFSF